MYEKYKSPFGYQVGDNGIDGYGVDHRNFSLRDEIEYQTARDNRESQMMQMYNQQGIMENYPQYTTNFWGDAGNNYGFGSSNITDAISTHPAMNSAPVPITQTPQAQTPTNNVQQLIMPAGSQYQITLPHNLQKYDNNFANYVSNTYDAINSAYNNIKEDYFGTRDYRNRYRQGCNPSNIAYNTISNYQISPHPKWVENGGVVSNFVMKKILSAIPFVGNYVNGIAVGDQLTNGVTNLYNAMEEADCFK